MENKEHLNENKQLALQKIANHDHEIYALLKQRYSPRIFSNKEIPETEMLQLFEAVRWSASSNNLQPWRFIYAHKGTEGYDNIMNCLDKFNQDWAINAPVLILAGYKENKENGDENFHALHDLGLSLGSMTVQAQYMNIALHHMAGVNWKKAHEDFDVPEGYHISTAIALGYYGGDLDDLSEDLQKQEAAKRERKPQSDFVFKDTWDNTETKK